MGWKSLFYWFTSFTALNLQFIFQIQASSSPINSFINIYQLCSEFRTFFQVLSLFFYYNNRFMIQSDNEKYAFMVDVSGSTGDSEHYWKTVADLFSLYANDIGSYYEWDDEIRLISKKEMENQINSRSGKGGTQPEIVAKEIFDKKIGKVILITDGQVSDHSVKQCDRILQNYAFVKTICYIIASSTYGHLNMSVTCAFTRKCDNEVYQKNENSELKKLAQYTPEDYKILDTLDEISLQNFELNYEKIQGLIIALNMGKQGNIPLKNQIVVMKKRLTKQLSKQGKSDENFLIRKSLVEGNIEEALAILNQKVDNHLKNETVRNIQEKINHLISLCGDLRGKYDLNQIKSNKMAHADDAKEEELDQSLDPKLISDNLIECPIILDEDVPQILVDQCEPILVGLEKAVVSDITSCPLRILNYPDVKAKLKSRLSNFIGVKYADKFFKNPFTQKRLLGAIPLGCHESHIKTGNFTIAKMFSNGKILGNLNLFYAVIWHIIKQQQIEYLKEIEKNATEHLIFRIKNSKTMASLTGLSKYLISQVNTDVAVWFCVHSGALNLPPNQDTFRLHIYNMQPLIDIIQTLGYPIDKGVKNHVAKTKSLLSVLSAYKKLNPSERRNFDLAIKGLYQNSIQIAKQKIGKDVLENTEFINFIPVDGKANEIQIKKIISLLPKELQKLEVQDILYISSLLNPQKHHSQIILKYNEKSTENLEAKVCWEYGVNNYLGNQKQFVFNPKNYQLCSKEESKNWEEDIGIRCQGKIKNRFKAKKYFDQFLSKFRRIPNKDELVVWYWKRAIKGQTKSLPFLVSEWSERLIGDYESALGTSGLKLEEAIKRRAELFGKK